MEPCSKGTWQLLPASPVGGRLAWRVRWGNGGLLALGTGLLILAHDNQL